MTSSTDELARSRPRDLGLRLQQQQRVDDIDDVDDRPFSRLNIGSSHVLEPPPPTKSAVHCAARARTAPASIDNLLKHVFPTLAPGSSHDFGHMPWPEPARERVEGVSPKLDSGCRICSTARTQLPTSRRSAASTASSSTPLQDAVKMATATATSTSSPSSTSGATAVALWTRRRRSRAAADGASIIPRAALAGRRGGIEAQPVIANVNTRSFDWNKHQDAANSNGRPRSGFAARGVFPATKAT
ncbi:hypothetical protein PINS_up005221 [Pythium insidiosum]|nr:hypothetical protein PINS_up005221 [Pythium insidiosum]